MVTPNLKKVLIIEDEEPMRRVLIDEFKAEGFSPIEACDGGEGLEIALKEKPDIILLDIMMQEMDGLTMLKKLREDRWGQTVPVLLLTNLSDIDKVSEAIQIGIAGYLVKSDWKLEDVINKVKDQLGMPKTKVVKEKAQG
ncbi:response regulator [Candidatus Dojkabacteria bacterium]|nr:response regulator [Candidatus Dojkabacteria bacterium]